jgi:hypothetical protein
MTVRFPYMTCVLLFPLWPGAASGGDRTFGLDALLDGLNDRTSVPAAARDAADWIEALEPKSGRTCCCCCAGFWDGATTACLSAACASAATVTADSDWAPEIPAASPCADQPGRSSDSGESGGMANAMIVELNR